MRKKQKNHRIIDKIRLLLDDSRVGFERSKPTLTSLAFFISVLFVYVAFVPVSAQDLPASVTIKPSLNLTIPTDTVTLTLDPTTAPFASKSIDITVGTNNPAGYWLTMSSVGTDNTSLVNTADSSKTIPTLTSSTSEADFPANRWGYRIGVDNSSNYLPYTFGMTIGSNGSRVNNDTTTLTLASKVDYLTTPGDYEQIFSIQALPNITQYYMQDIKDYEIPASQICNEQTPTIVIDKRDEQAYTIQRLPDGNCWMLDNLNLDLTSRTVAENLTTENTNASTEALNYLLNGGGTTTNKWAVNGLTFANWTDVDSYESPLVNKNGSCNTTSVYPCTYNGAYTSNTILSTLTPNVSTFGLGFGKIGIYYNYCAASAGSYCYEARGTASGSAEYDICPSNWRMPSSGDNGDFTNLCKAMTDSDCDGTTASVATNSSSLQYRLSLLLSGDYYDKTTKRQGANGVFWQSGYSSASAMNILFIGPESFRTGSGYNRHGGASVRCLLQE